MMRMKKWMVAGMAVLVVAVPMMVVSAQETLTAGEAALGELDSAEAELTFTYEAANNEIFVIEYEYTSDDIFSDPLVGVVDGDGDEVISVDDFNFSPLYVYADEPGAYTITLRPADADTLGEVSVRVVQPVTLEAGSTVEAERAAEQYNYYVYTGEDSFVLRYSQESQKPFAVSINTFSEFSPGSVFPVAEASGEVLTQASLGVVPGGERYVIVVRDGLYFSFDSSSAPYTLELAAGE
jgi:hypothetical protein